MKKLVLIVFALLAGALLIQAGMKYHQKQTFVTACETRQSETNVFLTALRDADESRCASLSPSLRERCLAFIANDPTLCASEDLDCLAIASRDPTKCAEPLCSAMASGNETHCESLGESTDWCKQMVRHEPSPVDTRVCEELSSQAA